MIKVPWKRKAESIENALRNVLPAELVNSIIVDGKPENFIDRIAAAVPELTVKDILVAVANELQIEAVGELQIPAASLIKRVGHDASELESLHVIPQRCEFGYRLVSANPEIVDVPGYQAIGVKVAIANGALIRQTWARFRALQAAEASLPTEQESIKALLKLARYAQKLGAQEVLLGIPDLQHYELSANGKIYRGKISQVLLKKLGNLTQSSGPIQWDLRTRDIETLNLGAVFCSGRVSFFLSWKLASCQKNVEEQASAKPTIRANVVKSESAHIGVRAEVWIVDDDLEFGKLAANIIKSHSLPYRLFDNAKSICRSLAECQHQPAVVVVDLHMPDVDGASLVYRLRQISPNSSLLVLTSDEDPQVEADLVNMGVNAFVKKSESPKVMMAWVNNCLSQKLSVVDKVERAAVA